MLSKNQTNLLYLLESTLNSEKSILTNLGEKKIVVDTIIKYWKININNASFVFWIVPPLSNKSLTTCSRLKVIILKI